MTEHPGIVFRDGPSGRRAGLAGGLDVWEVVAVLRRQGERGEAAVRAFGEETGLTGQQVRTALSYFASYQEEILRRIEANEQAAKTASANWEAQQRLLS